MKIKYRHCADPTVWKELDSVVLNERDTAFHRAFFGDLRSPMERQEEYDKRLLEKLENDKKNGIVLEYKVNCNE